MDKSDIVGFQDVIRESSLVEDIQISGANVEQEKDCISRCQEEFIDCAEYDHSDCIANFKECAGACEL